jgi:hypothetical protein
LWTFVTHSSFSESSTETKKRLKETSTQTKQNQKIKRNTDIILTRLYGREGEVAAWAIAGRGRWHRHRRKQRRQRRCVTMCATRAFSASVSDGGPSCRGPCCGGRAGVDDGVGRLRDVQPVVPGVGVGGGRRALECRSMPRDCA